MPKVDIKSNGTVTSGSSKGLTIEERASRRQRGKRERAKKKENKNADCFRLFSVSLKCRQIL